MPQELTLWKIKILTKWEKVILAIDFYKNIKERRKEFINKEIPTSLIGKDRELWLHVNNIIVPQVSD